MSTRNTPEAERTIEPAINPVVEPGLERESGMPFEIDRGLYARMYGPTTGDRVRLGDTNLLVEVERDEAQPGDETLWGFGKTIRDGLQMSGRAGRDSELDLIIGGALILDPVLGIFKGNIGIKEGRIVSIGRAGNPDIADDITVVSGA